RIEYQPPCTGEIHHQQFCLISERDFALRVLLHLHQENRHLGVLQELLADTSHQVLLPVIVSSSDHDDQSGMMLEAPADLWNLLNCMIVAVPYCYLQSLLA